MSLETAVILSGQTAGLGVIRALGRKDVPVQVCYHDPREMGRKSKYVLKEFCLPDPATEEEAFVERLQDRQIGSTGAILIPTSDATLSVVSRNKAALQQKYVVACPDWEITQKFLDKKFTCAIAENAGVPAPHTFLPKRVEDIDALEGVIQFPCLAKPSQSHRFRLYYNRKMTWVNNMAELQSAFKGLAGTDVELMVQEYIPGEDHLGANYNAYYWEGEPLCEFTAHKIRNAPPAMGSPCALISETIPEVIEMGRKLLGTVRYSGFACTEFKRDPRDGRYKLMEVNARHNLSSLLAVTCGMNFPWLEYRHLLTGVSPQEEQYERGIYWVDAVRDFRYWAAGLGKNGFTLGQFLEPYIHKHVFAVFDWKDPMPGMVRIKDIARMAINPMMREKAL
ncbi:MAG TPA: hypothetical protein VGJ97_04760 [Anaerolineaceae bacterium]|jgi:predicted ATP-grasp superfamily ATP-dependent carboligase